MHPRRSSLYPQITQISWTTKQRRARYHIIRVGFDQAHALSAAAGLANLAGIKTNEFRLLSNNHDLRFGLDREDGNDLAGLCGGLHIDDTFAAARLQPISSDRRLLAVALLGNRKHLLRVVRRNCAKRHDDIILTQIDAARTPGSSPHRPRVLFVEANRKTIAGG